MKIKGFTFVLASTLLISACSQDAPERMAGLTPFQHTQNIATQWSLRVGHGSRGNYLRQNPQVAASNIFTADYDGNVVSANRFDGVLNWHTELEARLTSGAGIGDGKVLVGGDNGQVIALSQKTGKMLWVTHVTGEVLATPTVSNNIVFVKTTSGQLYALSANNGRRLWRYKVDNPSLILRGDSSVVTRGRLAIAGFADGSVVAFDQQTGRRVWERQLAVPHGMSAVERMVDITANLQIVGNTLYVASYQGRIAALQVDNGRTRWQRDFSAYAGLTVGPRAVYASDANGHVWAFARRDGQVLWHNDLLDGRDLSGPAFVQNSVVVGDKQGYVHWLDARDGHFTARVRADHTRIDAAPLAQSPMVYVYTEGGDLLGYRVS